MRLGEDKLDFELKFTYSYWDDYNYEVIEREDVTICHVENRMIILL